MSCASKKPFLRWCSPPHSGPDCIFFPGVEMTGCNKRAQKLREQQETPPTISLGIRLSHMESDVKGHCWSFHLFMGARIWCKGRVVAMEAIEVFLRSYFSCFRAFPDGCSSCSILNGRRSYASELSWAQNNRLTLRRVRSRRGVIRSTSLSLLLRHKTLHRNVGKVYVLRAIVRGA